MIEVVQNESNLEKRKASMFFLIGATIFIWGVLISGFYFFFNGIF